MTTDALVVVGPNRFEASLEPAAALEVAAAEGVQHLLAAPARPPDYHLEPANEALADVCASSEGRLALLGRVDPRNGARGVAEAVRCLDELGARGLFLHPGEEWCPLADAADVLAVAADRGRPVVVATGYYGLSEPLQVAEVAAAFPSLPVVMTTGGQINISGLSMADAWTALQGAPNLHVLTNGEYRQDFVERLAGDLPDQVLFGSFAPVFDQRFELRRVRAARMEAEARDAVERGNAARLFGTP
jgi:uncharacterized protein